MNTLALALRNLIRNRRRSLATLLAMIVGSASLLLFGGYTANIQYSMQTAYVRSGGHLQIQHRDYYLYGSGNPAAYGIERYEPLLQALRNDEKLKPMLLVVTPTLQFGGIAGNYDAGVSRTVIGNGMVAPDISRMRDWNDYDLPLVSPPFALDGASADAAILGVGVARVLQLCKPLNIAHCPAPERNVAAKGEALPDDIAQLSSREAAAASATPVAASRHPKIELLASTGSGAPNVASLQVVRAEGQGFKELDEVYVIMQLPQTQKLIYGRAPPRVTSILLQLRHSHQVGKARDRINEILAGMNLPQPLAVLDFEALNPFYVQTIQLFSTLFSFIFALIGSIVLFTVSNTMNTAVVERTVEIGTLRAIGERRAGIRRLFLAEGMMLGVVGACAGAAFAIVASIVVNRMGLTWLPPGSSERLPLILRVWGETSMIVGTTVGLIVIATLSAWWPAWRAARLKITDALRHV